MQLILQDINLGSNLKHLRKNSGLTQQEVAAKMQLLGSNMSSDTYSKIETGVRNIKVSELVLLRKVFSADYSDFFEGI